MGKTSILIFCAVIFACGHSISRHEHVILDYKNFGPPALAHELIGMDYWQWDNHGDSRPRDYPIKVVVYRNVEVQKIKDRFPVIAEKEQDYRYVAYQTAMAYLNDTIAELQSLKDETFQKLVDTLVKTRGLIETELGDR
jgi:hypothetical protein